MNKYLITICFLFCINGFSKDGVSQTDNLMLENLKSAQENLFAISNGNGEYWEKSFSDEFRILQKILRENPSLLIQNWNTLTQSKTIPQKKLLVLALMYNSYANYAPESLDANFDLKTYLNNLPSMLELQKKENEKELYYFAIDPIVLSCNYSYPQIKSILNDIIRTSKEWGAVDKADFFQKIADGSNYINTLKYAFIPPADGGIRRDYKTYYIDYENNSNLLFLEMAYSQGLENAEYFKEKISPTIKTSLRNKQDMTLQNAIDYYRTYPSKNPASNFYTSYGAAPEKSQDIYYESYSRAYLAELELLKRIKSQNIPMERRMMSVKLLWNGLYADDQPERFFELLKSPEKEIREVAFNAISTLLKNDIEFDTSKVQSDEKIKLTLMILQKELKERTNKLIHVVP